MELEGRRKEAVWVGEHRLGKQLMREQDVVQRHREDGDPSRERVLGWQRPAKIQDSLTG